MGNLLRRGLMGNLLRRGLMGNLLRRGQRLSRVGGPTLYYNTIGKRSSDHVNIPYLTDSVKIKVTNCYKAKYSVDSPLCDYVT